VFQPGFFGFSVQFDVFPPFGEGHNGQKGDDDNFDEWITFFPFDPWVFDVVKKVDNGWYSFGDHYYLFFTPFFNALALVNESLVIDTNLWDLSAILS
jgi:hypothetical protein